MGRRFCKQTIRDVAVDGRTILVRTDYNVPLRDGQIADDLRIRASLPTLRYLLERGCRVVLMSHLGRPSGREAALSLQPIAERLEQLLGQPVRWVDDCVGDQVRRAAKALAPGQVLLLENLRFYPEEEADDAVFARAIVQAVHPDYVVQDGFGVVHRAHASTRAISLLVPSIAGLLLEKEVTAITSALERPARPLVAVIGGAKVSDKLALISRLIDRADTILIGGAMANTFLAYRGYDMADSLVEPDQQTALEEIYQTAARKVGADTVDDFLLLPVDVAVGRSEAATVRREVAVDKLRPGDKALDIGSRTIERFVAAVQQAGTVVWNGPLGYTTTESFAIGSACVALAIAQQQTATSIIGGGDTAEFILRWDGHDGASFSHVSTGGGASLELMAGQPLPGVENLLDAHGLGCYTKHKEYHDAEVDHR